MSDKRIDEFATLEELGDNDLLLVSSGEETYNTRLETLKNYAGGAANAVETAQSALAAAQGASETALAASTIAVEAKQLAQNAQTSAQNAETSAQQAQNQAENASNAALVASNAATVASSAAITATNAKQEIDELSRKIQSMYPNLVKDVTVNDTEDALIISFWDENEVEIPYAPGGGGLAFNSGYVDEENKLHLTLDGEDIDGFDPFIIPAGSGGGSDGSRITFSLTSGINMSVPESSADALITFNFASVDTSTSLETGAGTLQIYVGGLLKKSLTVQQGSNSVNVRDYLTNGSNTVKLVITDSYGMTATRNCSISVESLTLSWNLDSTIKNSGTLYVDLTPVGTGSKTVVLVVDGTEYSRDVVSTSGRRLSKSITNLSHGGHIVEAYCKLEINGNEILSNTLVSAIAQVDETNTAPVIAAAFTMDTVEQFTSITTPFRVIDSNNNPADVDFYVNDTLINSIKVDQSEQLWTYRPTQAGSITLKIQSGSVSWIKTLTVTGLNIPVNEVTDNLQFKLEPSIMTSLDSITLSDNFDTVNGGLVTDSDGVRCLKVVKGDRATIGFTPFSNDARKSGKEIKIIYKVDNCSDFEASAISCKQSGIGFEIKANKCAFYSEQSAIEMQTCEGEKSELDFNIQSDNANKLMFIWEDGSPAKAIQYADGDNFTQNSPVGITIGSDDCNVYVYLIRCYSTDLSDTEIKANYIFDGADGEQITKRYNSSLVYDSAGNVDPDKCAEVCPEAHVITFHAPSISTAKTNKVTGTLTHKYVAGGAAHNWTANNVVNKVQGTSSAAYVLAGLNHDFEAKEGFTLEDGTVIDGYAMTAQSMPVNYFNFKLNVASSENINNILLSEWYNRFQPYIRQAKTDDARVRDTVEGHMALLFYHNTGTSAVQAGATIVSPGETIFYGIGTLNNSKKNYDLFAQNDEDDVIVIEGCNNTSDQNRFKSDDLSNENFDGSGSYEYRYLSDTVTESEAKALWQNALSFVVSCNPEQATNEPLAQSVTYDNKTYNNDTAEYRKAKFKAEADNHFVMDSVLYHQLFTLAFCMVDNRAKNMFWGYSKLQGKWHLNFSYDHDTGLGNDNEGGLTLRYGYLDTDTIGTKSVFNAADSTLFNLVSEVFADDLREMYISRENLGCWDFDEFKRLCDEYQGYICPTLWVEDAEKKYISPLVNNGSSAYISMLNGRKKLQRAQFLKFQRQFIASYFIGNYATSNTGQIRGYTPSTWSGVAPKSSITITPYCDMFVTVKAGSETLQQRAYAGQPVTLDFTRVGSMNDTEIYPYNAPFIQDIGDISCLYPGYCDLSAFTRLKKAQIGSSVTGYVNTNFNDVKVTNCEALEELNIENCPSFTSALDLSNNIMLKKLYTRGSNASGVTFANGGRLQEALLNGVISLTAKHLYYINTLSLETYQNLSTLIVEDAPSIDTQTIVSASDNLTRVRLIEVDWAMQNSALLIALSKIKGIDDDGYSAEIAVLTGKATVNDMSDSRLSALQGVFPQLEINVLNSIPEYTVKFVLDDEGLIVYDEQIVERGSAAQRPEVDPTKESSVSTVYSFVGWGGSFSNILQNTTIKAQWSESVRQYRVRWYNQSALVHEATVDYGEPCYYQGDDLTRAGYLWTGWDKNTDFIDSDLDVNAVYETPSLPAEIKDMSEYDFIVSDDPNDNAAYTHAELYAIAAAGLGKTYFAVGDKAKIIFDKTKTITDEYVIVRIDDFNHYRLENGGEKDTPHDEGDYSCFANIVFGMVGVLNVNYSMHTTNTNVGGWDMTRRRELLNSTTFKDLPPVWRSIIKPVQVSSTIGNSSESIVTSIDRLFIYSQTDMGLSKVVPYKAEVDAAAENQVLPYYTNNTSRIKKRYNGTGDAVTYWLRSPYQGSASAFCDVDRNGVGTSGGASHLGNGISFSFCV